MNTFDKNILKQLYIPSPDSHKGQNGKLLLIGGSTLFHAASLWALTIASKIVDMVFYASVPENNAIVQHAKQEFRNGIVITRNSLDDYAAEADCILIGPGMMRAANAQSLELRAESLQEINRLEDEGIQTRLLTKYMIEKYPEKKFVLDAGALQMMDPEWLRILHGNVIITPHPREFAVLFNKEQVSGEENMHDQVAAMARKYNTIILLKGQEDIVASPKEAVTIIGGNAGMTKGGTGDVLAGLVAALACNNDLFLSATAGSYFNKKAGESLASRVGLSFNASDLANEIPSVMHTAT